MPPPTIKMHPYIFLFRSSFAKGNLCFSFKIPIRLLNKNVIAEKIFATAIIKLAFAELYFYSKRTIFIIF